MIKLTCIKDCDDSFVEGRDYVLLTRRGGGFVEVLREDGFARDFIIGYDPGAPYYDILGVYFNLVPVNRRRVMMEKINHTYEFKI